MKTMELKELMPPHVVDVQGHGINEFYTPEQVVEILRLLSVSECVHPLAELVNGDEGLFCCKCQKYVRTDAHIH